MDNITHTLVGAALGYAGLKRRSGLALPALMISANIPDIDILYLLVGEGMSGRRGWTHGPIGVLVLPAILALALVWFDAWQERRGKRPTDRAPVRFNQLLLLSYIGAISHPLLDLMNTWGIRLLMPFSERWYYGDALFIADPWIWLALGLGIWLSRRRARQGARTTATPAIISLSAVILYTSAMALAGRAAEARVALYSRETGLGEPQRVLANPVFGNPFRREIVVKIGESYGFGDFRWLPTPQLTLDKNLIPSHMNTAAVTAALDSAARHDKAIAEFLYWSRFPFAGIEKAPSGVKVMLNDARYAQTLDGGLLGVTTTLEDTAADHPSEQ